MAECQSGCPSLWEDNARLLGFIGLEKDYIAGIFVDRAARSQGIGTRLLDRVKENHDTLTLKVYAKNERALRFYERAGFRMGAQDREEETGELSTDNSSTSSRLLQ
ncbi:GNAT family N-acetyltransferase [Anaerolentibacter hominis]|uniref:GNAT family N-acetyltransferase n=1 Tax=Anaerolentibacter hominis TaxID=3079009 RepID=UPI0031B84629